MNKLKQRLANLKAHLWRDARGLELLDEVTEVANQIRKDLAAANELHDSSRRRAESLIDRLKESQSVIDLQRDELARERAVAKQAQGTVRAMSDRIASLEGQLAALTPPDIEVPERTERAPGFATPTESRLLEDLSEFTNVFNQLRKQMRFAPRPVAARERSKNFNELSHVISALSSDYLLKLGRFVACKTLLTGLCCMQSEVLLKDAWNGKAVPDSFAKPLAQWFGRNIDCGSVDYCEPDIMSRGVPEHRQFDGRY